jgi:hypothetical protein
MRPRVLRSALVLVVCGLSVAVPPPPAPAQTVFTVPANNVRSTLGARHLTGAGTLEVKSGEGSLFGTPSPAAPIRVTVARANTLVNDEVAQSSTFTIFKATGRSGDILTGVTAIEGTADRDYARNDPVRMTITAGMFSDLHAAVNALEGGAVLGAPVRDKGGQVYNVRSYGAVPDDGLDDYPAVAAALAAADSAGGGVIYFPPGTWRIDSQLLIPNDGATPPSQKSIVLRGCGAASRTGVPVGGTQLDLRYGTAGDWKVKTRGFGTLAVDDVTFKDGGAGDAHLFLTTNTTVHLNRCAFIGNKSGPACNQDALTFGGNSTTIDGTDSSPFQGYGSTVRRCFFDHVRRAFIGNAYCNGNTISGNTVWLNCGTNLADDAPFVLNGNAGSGNDGNVFDGNLIQAAINHAYIFKSSYSLHNTFHANNIYDPQPTLVAYYRFEVSAGWNYVRAGFHDDTKTGLSDVSGTNDYDTSHQGQTSYRRQPHHFSGGITLAQDGTGVILLRNAGDVAALNYIAADTMSLRAMPNGGSPDDLLVVRRISISDHRLFGGSAAGVTLSLRGTSDAAGGPVSINGIPFNADGTIGTGSGNVDARAAAFRVLNAAGTVVGTVGGGVFRVIPPGAGSNQSQIWIRGAGDAAGWIVGRDIGNVDANDFYIFDHAAGATRVAIAAGTGAVSVPGTFAVGGGSALVRALSTTATLDFPSIAGAGQAELTVAVVGAAANDVVDLGPPAAPEAGLSWDGYVSAADTVRVRVGNRTAGAIDPASATWRVEVRKY